MTVARFRKLEDAEEWLEENRQVFEEHFPIEFDVGEIHVLGRFGKEHCFRIMESIQLEDSVMYYGTERILVDEKEENSVVMFNVPEGLRDNALLKEFVKNEGFSCINAEIALHKDRKKPREFGVVEFEDKSDAQRILKYQFPQYPDIECVELGMTPYPDAIGRSTSPSLT